MFGKIVLNITSIIWSLVFSELQWQFKSAPFLASAVQCSVKEIASAARATTYFDMLRDFGFWLTSITMLTNCLLLTAYWFVAFQLWNWWFSFSFGEDEIFEDPLHKYESIPLEFDDTNFVKKKLNTKSSESEDSDSESHTSVNYAYHPIIDFFNQSWLNNQYLYSQIL